MKKLLSLIMALIISLSLVPSVSCATDDGNLSSTEINAAGNRALNYLQDRQQEILDSNSNAKYTILASYYPGKAGKAVTIELENCGFTYDNSLAALAFISAGDKTRSSYILDGFEYALTHDRSGEIKLRNAYRTGTLADSNFGALLPGFWNGSWSEDAYQVGTNLGNTSWAVIAMLQYDRIFKTDRYLNSATKAMDYVLNNFKNDAYPGISSGYDGWAENGSQSIPLKARKDVQWYTYKSTECNLDAAVAFKNLYKATKKAKYKDAYEDCLKMVKSMYVSSEKRYVVGTTTDGKTKNTKNTFTDAIAWPVLAIYDELNDKTAITESLKNMITEGGLPFVCLGIPADKKFESTGGIWHEGSIFGSMALKKLGCTQETNAIMTKVIANQDRSGAFTSASTSLFADNTWRYGCVDYHIAPTAWMVMYAKNFNPFNFGDTSTPVAKKPAKPTSVTLKAGKKSLTVKWAKPSKANLKNISSYELRYSMKSNMANSTVVKIGKSKTSASIKKLKSKRKHYVQLRSINGDKKSAWTSKKSVKVR